MRANSGTPTKRGNPCESEPLGVWTPTSAIEALQAILHGRWGVVQGCDCRSILAAIATLIEAQRPDLAVVLIEKELNSQT